MPADDGAKREVPREAGSDQGNVHAIAGRAEQVPAAPERVREKRDNVLPLDQEEHEVVGNMIADGNWHQGQCECARHLEPRRCPTADPVHDAADAEISAEEQAPESDKPDGPDGSGPNRRKPPAYGALEQFPLAGA